MAKMIILTVVLISMVLAEDKTPNPTANLLKQSPSKRHTYNDFNGYNILDTKFISNFQYGKGAFYPGFLAAKAPSGEFQGFLHPVYPAFTEPLPEAKIDCFEFASLPPPSPAVDCDTLPAHVDTFFPSPAPATIHSPPQPLPAFPLPEHLLIHHPSAPIEHYIPPTPCPAHTIPERLDTAVIPVAPLFSSPAPETLPAPPAPLLISPSPEPCVHSGTPNFPAAPHSPPVYLPAFPSPESLPVLPAPVHIEHYAPPAPYLNQTLSEHFDMAAHQAAPLPKPLPAPPVPYPEHIHALPAIGPYYTSPQHTDTFISAKPLTHPPSAYTETFKPAEPPCKVHHTSVPAQVQTFVPAPPEPLAPASASLKEPAPASLPESAPAGLSEPAPSSTLLADRPLSPGIGGRFGFTTKGTMTAGAD